MGSDCRDLLTVDFMSLLRTRGEEPIQAGSSQLLFPDCSILVGLVGALIARSYIWTQSSGTSVALAQGRECKKKKILDRFLTLLTASVAMPSMAAPPTPKTSLAFESMKSMAVPMPLSSFFPLRSPFTPAILPLRHINVNIEGKETVQLT